MRITNIKQQARRSLSNNWGYAVLVTIIVGVVNMIPNLIESMLSGHFIDISAADHAPWFAQLISYLLSIFLIPLSIGYNWYNLALLRGKREKWTSVFEPFDVSIYLKMLGGSLLIAIYSFLWSLLLIVPGIIKSMAYSQTFYILKDHPELTVNQAITRSRKLMDGYKWKYFLFMLSFIGWGLLCVVTAGIALLWVAPYYNTACASFYNELIESEDKRF
ncbi:DUF975 family protein [Pullulanibacillus sp. KACC 23026]|uniref:DUF975 family protein n=1 Tax=Pullulanibacillus sp. KACC 23026 TaxID=3028315 RepID=UPI0023B04345|nr:DUF975 family protein [Pullulanibacillus sp. KACC 23026]WEG10827.1 DUF975 family protein [Pullulanibacillus sp. KACC 23026]